MIALPFRVRATWLSWQSAFVSASTVTIHVAITFVLLVRPAWSGPPMVLDNTGTTTAGSVEFLIYFSGELRDSNKTAELPGIEIAYGLTSTTELSFVLPRQVSDGVAIIDEETVPSLPKRDAGLGEGGIGWKWRFLESGPYALAFAPAFLFPITESAQIRGLVQVTHLWSVAP